MINSIMVKTNNWFRMVQVLTSDVQSYAHVTNDAQKSMGIITMALIVGGMHETTDVPLWVQASCALAMALGTSIGGWRIIKTVGGKIMKIILPPTVLIIRQPPIDVPNYENSSS